MADVAAKPVLTPAFPHVVPTTGSPLGGDVVAVKDVWVTDRSTITFDGVPATRLDTGEGLEATVVTPPGHGPVSVVVTTPAEDGSAPGTAPTVADLGFSYSELTLDVIRPDDLLSLRFELINLRPDGSVLSRRDPVADAFVVVTFAPQHIGEQQFPLIVGVPPAGPPASAVLAGKSQLRFQVPAATTSIPFTMAALLDWGAWLPVPPAGAIGVPTMPGTDTTVIELPYRMLLTVDGDAGWSHPTTAPDPTADAVELWRTTAPAPTLRVLWSPDLPQPPRLGAGGDFGRPNAADRSAIAAQAPALDNNGLTLSALGGSVDLRALLSDTAALASWRHVVADGRDCYVRLVTRGALAPFGHKASVITVVERRPEQATDGSVVEAMMSTSIVVVTQPEVSYLGAFDSDDHPPLPFRTVRITTLITPPVDTSGQTVETVGMGHLPVQFHLTATDLGGEAIDLTMPLVFVPLTAAVADPQSVADAVTALQAGGDTDLRGQAVHLVPPAPAPVVGAAAPQSVAGAVTTGGRLAVAAMGFDVQAAAAGVAADVARTPALLATMAVAHVGVPGTDAVAGAVSTWAIGYAGTYLDAGFAPEQNVGQVFAELTDSQVLGLPAEQAGGLVAPALNVAGLSRSLGPVGPIAAAALGHFDPATAIDLGAQLLGGLTLKDVLALVQPVAGFDPSQVPALVRSELPDAVQVSFSWNPPLQSTSVGSVLDLDLDEATLSLENTSIAYTDPSRAPSSVVTGTLAGAGLTFLDAITLHVDQLTFTAEVGKKTKLTTHNMTVAFDDKGDLAFLKPLADALPPDGFADGPSVEVTASGVKVGYTLALPAIGLGILSIENLSFTAGLSLPFTAPLGLQLAFSSREHPFLVTVSIIGGGGYFGIDVGSDGVRQIEGALELGANISVDLLIVTANVHVLAGFYFSMSAGGTSFSGYLRIGGSVDLLGIISVSIELYLALAYNSNHGEIVGTASLTVSVHVMFLSKTLTLSVEKHFAVPGRSSAARVAPVSTAAVGNQPLDGADPGDDAVPSPTFEQIMTIDDWRLYRQAFV